MAYERTCIVDKTEYRYCHRCAEFKNQPMWKYMFCSNNCRQIYNICGNFKEGNLTANEAQKKLNKCDLSNYCDLADTLKEQIDKIKKESAPKKSKKQKKKMEEDIVKDEIIESSDIAPEIKEEIDE